MRLREGAAVEFAQLVEDGCGGSDDNSGLKRDDLPFGQKGERVHDRNERQRGVDERGSGSHLHSDVAVGRRESGGDAFSGAPSYTCAYDRWG